MPLFPVIPDELDDAQQRLGINLPSRYVERLTQPGVSGLLAHRALGLIAPDARMHDFVRLTEEVRRTVPGFPADGVVASAPQGRYFRFWLPERGDPTRLGEMRHTWDTVTGRHRRDCSNDASVQLALEALHATDPDAFIAAGVPAPAVLQPAQRVRVRSADASVIARLGQRNDATQPARAGDGDDWTICASMQVSGRYLAPCDRGQIPEGRGTWALAVTPGTYDVMVRLSRSSRGNRVIVAAMRVVRSGSTPDHADPVSTIDVDTAGVVVFDRQAFFAQVQPTDRDGVADALAEVPDQLCVVVLGRTAEAAMVPSGDGDGRYPVYALLRGQAIVGLEIRFTA